VPLDDEGKQFLKTPDAKAHNQELLKIGELGALPKHDMLFTTYNQMQTVKGATTPRQAALRGLIRNAILILDESHNAGGTEVGAIQPKGMSRSTFVRQLVDGAKGVFYSSATYAKRPSVMDLYSKTDMAKAVDKPSDLAPAIATGGVPMQQVVASMLAEAGQYIRRERSFAGVTYEAKVVPVDRKSYEEFSSAIASIHKFSGIIKAAAKNIDKELKADAKRITPDGSTGGAGAQSTNFTAIMHNLVNQLLLAQKAGPSVQMAIEALKNDQKPVLTVANTMESFLQEYVEEHGIKPNDPVTLSFNDLLTATSNARARSRSRSRSHRRRAKRRYLTDDLGAHGVARYKAAQKAIKGGPRKPADLAHRLYARRARARRLQDCRDHRPRLRHFLRRSVETPRYYIRSQKKPRLQGAARRSKTSMGRSARDDPEPGRRHWPVAPCRREVQGPAPAAHDARAARGNIDTHMQMLGRVHRTGQVIEPNIRSSSPTFRPRSAPAPSSRRRWPRSTPRPRRRATARSPPTTSSTS
jgi:hypothetical protein